MWGAAVRGGCGPASRTSFRLPSGIGKGAVRAATRRCGTWLRDRSIRRSRDAPTYRDYLRLDTLLGQTRPLSPPDDARTRLDERFFIVVHQATELWLTQVGADLARARCCANAGSWTEACERVERASATLVLLICHLDHLDHLPRESFLVFRDRLGSASGAESEQCRDLLLGEDHPAIAALRARCAGPECGAAGQLSAALDEFVELVGTWRVRHAQLAWSFIGGRRGTGGTSGVSYLAARAQATASAARGASALRVHR